MKFWVGITDNDWYEFLRLKLPDEVNFWQPSGTKTFRALKPGAPFLFQLHSPKNYIVGGGFFVRHSVLPLYLAWEAFGEKNGSPSLETLHRQIQKYRANKDFVLDPHPEIGCIILNRPFFLPEQDWIPVQASSGWMGKTYASDEHAGTILWEQIQERLKSHALFSDYIHGSPLAEEAPLYGAEYLARARLGQGAFRVLVTDAYQRRCAITGQHTLPVLQASHIKPYSKSGPNKVSNGLLLRSDLHMLFDQGYLTITEDFHVEVSARIKSEYENGHIYYLMHGNDLKVVPSKGIDRPSVNFIEWHNHNVFVA